MAQSDGRLAGKVAIVTGCSSGLGPVVAKVFVDEGAQVLMVARREELVVEAARAIGPGAVGMRADISCEDDVAAMVERTLQEFGKVDILINNAMVSGKNLSIWEQTLDNWQSVLDVALMGQMLCIREVLNRSMLERRTGSIVNVSSGAAWTGMATKAQYASAKRGLQSFTKTVANEVGAYGIRCNCLVSGAIDNEAWRKSRLRIAAAQGVDYETVRARFIESMPLRTISTPENMADLALFLAGDESRTITGQSIACNAGSVMVG